ncbi:MAG: hypothetical protein Q9M32_03525 [Sulfurimonas sp.]|nr:hypothetical protein [Sulfurimonas sp.]MDQ7059954.1 hypothetical protein [Sulfurimonas sp.]
MKYSLLLVALLSSSSLVALEAMKTTSQMDSASQMNSASQINDLSNQIESLEIRLGEVNEDAKRNVQEQVLEKNKQIVISVIGQGVAPMNTSSPAQAYALAKRAAVSDAYRLIAEKVKGVRVDGQDVIKNMMVKRSTVRTSVNAMVRNANVVETTFKEGLCEVEMEIIIAHSQFAR